RVKIINDLASSGVWLLSICGGEPFLEPDLKELILLAKTGGLLVNVTTNGSLITENLNLISHLDFLTVSVDSVKETEHDRFRGFPGLFNKINRGLSAISLLERKPEVYVRCIIGKSNAAKMDSYINYWKNKVNGIVFQPIHHSPDMYFKAPPEFIQSELPEEEIFRQFILSLKKSRLLNVYNSGIPEFLSRDRQMRERFNCYSGYFSLEIDSAGNLWNCAEHKYRLGNLRDRDLLQLMTGERNKLRKINNRRNCICYHNCAIINIYLDHFFNLFRRKCIS
ncbi:MAG: hypothetical protein FJZ08_05945, partial [Candidatus Omnitrophica bacterium]|nr:hypothetical protein [Candidatus Omnitrophota bacterium]